MFDNLPAEFTQEINNTAVKQRYTILDMIMYL